jgi:hypothetical protein
MKAYIYAFFRCQIRRWNGVYKSNIPPWRLIANTVHKLQLRATTKAKWTHFPLCRQDCIQWHLGEFPPGPNAGNTASAIFQCRRPSINQSESKGRLSIARAHGNSVGNYLYSVALYRTCSIYIYMQSEQRKQVRAICMYINSPLTSISDPHCCWLQAAIWSGVKFSEKSQYSMSLLK